MINSIVEIHQFLWNNLSLENNSMLFIKQGNIQSNDDSSDNFETWENNTQVTIDKYNKEQTDNYWLITKYRYVLTLEITIYR